MSIISYCFTSVSNCPLGVSGRSFSLEEEAVVRQDEDGFYLGLDRFLDFRNVGSRAFKKILVPNEALVLPLSGVEEGSSRHEDQGFVVLEEGEGLHVLVELFVGVEGERVRVVIGSSDLEILKPHFDFLVFTLDLELMLERLRSLRANLRRRGLQGS